MKSSSLADRPDGAISSLEMMLPEFVSLTVLPVHGRPAKPEIPALRNSSINPGFTFSISTP
jgi:hypothetical protein